MQLTNPSAATDNCRYCLMCRHVCPVGIVTHNETLTPHGWALTIASVKRGLFDWNSETVNTLYSCADCGLCNAHCVTDQPLPEAIAAARAEVAAQNLAPAVSYALNDALVTWGNPYTQEAPHPVEGQGEYALFVGDDAHYLRPSLVEAALTLLRAAGIEPVLVGVGRNSGYLASSLGFPATAAALARANLDDIASSSAAHLLFLTPADHYTFTCLYDERLGITLPEGLQLSELTHFLAAQTAAGNLHFAKPTINNEDIPYVYLDPTLAARLNGRHTILRDHAAPRALLTAALGHPGRELFWRAERAHPCGNVALQFTQPHLAEQLTRARLADAAAQHAQTVITEDPSCLVHLEQYAADYNLHIQGLYELLAQHLE